MRSRKPTPRKNTTARAKGPVTTSRAKPADVARLQAAARAKRKQYDTWVSDDPKGLTPLPRLDGTTDTVPSLTQKEAEDLARAQARLRSGPIDRRSPMGSRLPHFLTSAAPQWRWGLLRLNPTTDHRSMRPALRSMANGQNDTSPLGRQKGQVAPV